MLLLKNLKKIGEVETTTTTSDNDDSLNARVFLKRAAEEYKDASDRYETVSKQYEGARLAALGKNTTALDQALAAVKEEKAGESDQIQKLVNEAKKFLDGLELKPQLEELRQLSGIRSYVTVIKRTLEIGNSLKRHFENGEWSSFVQVFSKELNDGLVQCLSKSSCSNLYGWLVRYADAWRRHGSSAISSLIVDHLESEHIPQDVLHADKRLTEEIRPLAQALYDLSATDTKETEPMSIVANVLLRPFFKRFIHHFCGGKGEQAIAGVKLTSGMTIKPEWYLSIVIKWHRQFTPWIEGLEVKGKDRDSKADADIDGGSDLGLFFARGLVDLARRRLKADLLQYAQDDPSVLPHLIDEAVSFDTDMKASNYSDTEPACVDILTEPGVFELWSQLEQSEASKCLDVFLNESEAWVLRYGDNAGASGDLAHVDSHKVPFVTDNLLLLLTAMKHRFRFVRSQEHRRIFVNIQCTLLLDFRERLVELSKTLSSPISSIVKAEKKQRLSPAFAHLVNSCSYICAVLTEWQESPAYLAIRTACFDEIINLYDHARRGLMRDACTAVLRELTSPIDDYRRSFAFYTGRGDTLLSGQATAFLYTPLQEAMSVLYQTLNRKNFQAFARQLAIGLEKLLIERVILELRLDQKSGEELQRQLGTTFVRVAFENYGVIGATAYFTRLAQYLHVAAMNAGNCMLLKEALKEHRVSAEHVLSEMGLENISVKEIEDLLQRRSDLI